MENPTPDNQEPLKDPDCNECVRPEGQCSHHCINLGERLKHEGYPTLNEAVRMAQYGAKKALNC